VDELAPVDVLPLVEALPLVDELLVDELPLVDALAFPDELPLEVLTAPPQACDPEELDALEAAVAPGAPPEPVVAGAPCKPPSPRQPATAAPPVARIAPQAHRQTRDRSLISCLRSTRRPAVARGPRTGSGGDFGVSLQCCRSRGNDGASPASM
jgi:hypothetical protein